MGEVKNGKGHAGATGAPLTRRQQKRARRRQAMAQRLANAQQQAPAQQPPRPAAPPPPPTPPAAAPTPRPRPQPSAAPRDVTATQPVLSTATNAPKAPKPLARKNGRRPRRWVRRRRRPALPRANIRPSRVWPACACARTSRSHCRQPLYSARPRSQRASSRRCPCACPISHKICQPRPPTAPRLPPWRAVHPCRRAASRIPSALPRPPRITVGSIRPSLRLSQQTPLRSRSGAGGSQKRP